MSPPVPSTTTQKTIQHFTHQPHPLTQTHDDPKEYLCDGCKTLGCGTRYRCNTCDFDLHEICAMSPSTLPSFYMHPEHPLSLVLRKQEGIRQVNRICDACDEQVNGLFYRCKICDFDVHPICIKLPQNVKHWVQPQHLWTLQPSSQLSLCNLCNLPCKSKSWSYKCAPCGAQLHINCLTRPRPHQPQPFYGAASNQFDVNNPAPSRDANTMPAHLGCNPAPPPIPSQTPTLPTWAKIQAGDQFPSGRFGCWEHMVVCHVAKSEVDWHSTGLKLAEAFFANGYFELFPFDDNKAIIIATSQDEQDLLCNGNHLLDEADLISLSPWNPQCNRIAENSPMVGWVGITGLPFHLWNPAMFADIAKHFGTMIVVDENTVFRDDLRMARIKVQGDLVRMPARMEIEEGDEVHQVELKLIQEPKDGQMGMIRIRAPPVSPSATPVNS